MSKKQDPQKIVLMALRQVYEDTPEVTRDGVYIQDMPLPDRPQFIVNVQNGNVVGNFYLKYSEVSVAGYKDYCVRAHFSKTGEWEKLFYSESVRPLSDTRSERVQNEMC
ncbi:MAG: hypothetical protein ACI4QM_00460, partial [Alphaproteobacteria bacterium]